MMMKKNGVPIKGAFIDEAPDQDIVFRAGGRAGGKSAISQAVSAAPPAVSRVVVPMPEVVRTRNYAEQNAGRTLTSKQRKRLHKKAGRKTAREQQGSVIPDGGLPNLTDATRFKPRPPGRVRLPE